MKKFNIAILVAKMHKIISSNFLPENSPGLERQQIYGIMLATVGASKFTKFMDVIESIIKDSVDDETISTAESAVAFVKSKNKHNELYRMGSEIVIEGITKTDLGRSESPLVNISEKHCKNDVDFMLYTLAASYVVDFDYYINIRDKLAHGDDISDIAINSVIRIATSVQSISEVVEKNTNQKTKILIVDDEVRLTRLLKLTLVRTGQFEIRTENRGSNAVNAARAFKPDLILLDIIMPDMGGEKVAQQIKDDAELCHIKIIYLTALLTREETGNTGKKIGGYMCLAKPVRDDDLIYCIEKQVSKSIAA
jgi:two-component system, OmpR family, response regulator